MNWKLITPFSLIGTPMGIVSVLGLIEMVELYIWIVLAIGTTSTLALKRPPRLMLHGITLGIVTALLNGSVCWLFFGTYVRNNPTAVSFLDQRTTFLSSSNFSLLMSLLIGLIYGTVVGIIAFLTVRLLKRPATAD